MLFKSLNIVLLLAAVFLTVVAGDHITTYVHPAGSRITEVRTMDRSGLSAGYNGYAGSRMGVSKRLNSQARLFKKRHAVEENKMDIVQERLNNDTDKAVPIQGKIVTVISEAIIVPKDNAMSQERVPSTEKVLSNEKVQLPSTERVNLPSNTVLPVPYQRSAETVLVPNGNIIPQKRIRLPSNERVNLPINTVLPVPYQRSVQTVLVPNGNIIPQERIFFPSNTAYGNTFLPIPYQPQGMYQQPIYYQQDPRLVPMPVVVYGNWAPAYDVPIQVAPVVNREYHSRGRNSGTSMDSSAGNSNAILTVY